MAPESENDLVDDAIVIKNIPFKYPEGNFMKLFPQMGLVSPKAFNYYRNKVDNKFHGLAFANFNSAYDALAVMNKLNGYELDGRLLQVEPKKRLSPEKQSCGQIRPSPSQSRQFNEPSLAQDIFQPVEPLKYIPKANDPLNPQLQPQIIFPSTSPSPIGISTISLANENPT